MQRYQEDDYWHYQSLISSLEEINNTFILNSGDYFIDYLKGKNPNTLFINQETGSGHFNEKGYRILAEYVYQKLSDLNY